MPQGKGIYPRYLKRLMDIVCASSLLILLLPVLTCVGLTIRLRMGRPVLFLQERPGLKNRPFRLVKFRTMRSATDGSGRPLPDGERLTRLGVTLRRWSLDELPQLVNVVRGEMSLVGPRPLLTEYVPLYSEQQLRRHDVRPGITGWAQTHGRNSISWKQKFEYDVWYVKHVSFLVDIKILVLTAVRVIRRDGISHEGHSTMPFFTGNDE